ncbi:EcsC family protein [Agromyces italicus]|uniref:EcsC family protein n=1 Tax=Agromyces italicus TaxID=279572 RepID=UPI0003B4009F|nr:EcsC family protein [Agromyces italicus]
MADPSDYELAAWRDVQRFKGRPLSRAMRGVGEQMALGFSAIGTQATTYLAKHPKTQAVVAKGQGAAVKTAQVVGTGAKQAVGAIPDGVTDWSGQAFDSIRRIVGRISRVALSPARVVELHQKRGHDVTDLADVRRLDLKQVDLVRGRAANWYYPATAALSGAGAGFLITGGELAVPVSGGASAAPSGAVIAGAMVGDAAIVLGLASRCVGQVSLHYGYDPEEPAEKLFIMSVVNAGTALSATAKTAAMADVSRLTQALVRGKVWSILDKSVVSQVSKQFAKAFGVRITKQSLGKVVPVAGIVLGGTFNWTTLEAIVDAANIAYRHRFLLEKYPSLAAEEVPVSVTAEAAEDADETISVLREVSDAGGPDLE